MTAAILSEILATLDQEGDDLDGEVLPATTWAAILSANVGAVARESMNEFESSLRAAVLRVAIDAVACLEQLDREPDDGARVTSDEVEEEEPVLQVAPEPDPPAEAETQPAMLASAVDDEAWWNGDRWRAHLRNFGVRVADAIRQAQEISRTVGQPEPGTLDAIKNPAVATQLRQWIETQAAGRAAVVA